MIKPQEKPLPLKEVVSDDNRSSIVSVRKNSCKAWYLERRYFAWGYKQDLIAPIKSSRSLRRAFFLIYAANKT